MTNLITSEDKALKQKVVTYIWPVAASFFVGYTLILFFVLHDYFSGFILLGDFFVFMLCMMIYFRTKSLTLAGNILASIGVPVLLPWLVTGGPNDVGFWWSTVYAVWAFIVSTKKQAIFWLSLYSVLAFFIVLFSQFGYYKIAYSIPSLLNLLYAFVTVTLYAYFLVAVIDYYLKLSQIRANELSNLNRDLEKANEASRQSQAAKEAFLASMSHEIRTPLNAVIGFQQLLKETPLNDEQKEYVESIDFAGRNLLLVINDILDLSKIEAGKFEFEETAFNVNDTIKSAIDLVKQRAKEKNIIIYTSSDSAIPNTLYGDSGRLTQILLNLIGNAIKFTEEGEVKISVKMIAESDESISCEFKIIDTGIGIPEEKLSAIFERFSQANTDTTRKYGGSGLGLTICKYLVEMQGGQLKVESEVGKGSTFGFLLDFKKVSSISFSSHSPSAVSTIKENQKLSILLAEDIALNQRLVVKIMEKWGHDLEIADNGKVAVEKLLNNHYDLILMDIQMPVMDGYQAVSLIREMEDEAKRKTPIIALTAHASHAEAERCINLGMNAYLAKPFNKQQLQNVIHQLLYNNE